MSGIYVGRKTIAFPYQPEELVQQICELVAQGSGDDPLHRELSGYAKNIQHSVFHATYFPYGLIEVEVNNLVDNSGARLEAYVDADSQLSHAKVLRYSPGIWEQHLKETLNG